ncbi:hypothetical protein P692DRAFT_201796972 [Suillus brevipes Sb2]|nr:hypothetical protein P692DRAFT_201796972 [Suillus brevipes Sb2]
MGWVVVVRLLHLVHLVQDVSRMLKRRQAECAMMMPGLWRAIGLAHVLVLLSRIVGSEQPSKPACPALQPHRQHENGLDVAQVRFPHWCGACQQKTLVGIYRRRQTGQDIA